LSGRSGLARLNNVGLVRRNHGGGPALRGSGELHPCAPIQAGGQHELAPHSMEKTLEIMSHFLLKLVVVGHGYGKGQMIAV